MAHTAAPAGPVPSGSAGGIPLIAAVEGLAKALFAAFIFFACFAFSETSPYDAVAIPTILLYACAINLETCVDASPSNPVLSGYVCKHIALPLIGGPLPTFFHWDYLHLWQCSSGRTQGSLPTTSSTPLLARRSRRCPKSWPGPRRHQASLILRRDYRSFLGRWSDTGS